MLSPYFEDYLKESFNRGLGKASVSIGDLTGSEAEIKFAVPRLKLEGLGEFKNKIAIHDKICGIKQRFSGDFEGIAMLFFSPAIGKKLIQILLDADIPVDYITDIESDALAEIGSVLINHNLKAIVDDLGKTFTSYPPQFSYKNPFQYFSPEEFQHEKQIFRLEISLSHGEETQLGRISLILYFKNAVELVSSVDSYMNELLGEAT